jgi:hypothetical protein
MWNSFQVYIFSFVLSVVPLKRMVVAQHRRGIIFWVISPPRSCNVPFVLNLFSSFLFLSEVSLKSKLYQSHTYGIPVSAHANEIIRRVSAVLSYSRVFSRYGDAWPFGNITLRFVLDAPFFSTPPAVRYLTSFVKQKPHLPISQGIYHFSPCQKLYDSSWRVYGK